MIGSLAMIRPLAISACAGLGFPTRAVGASPAPFKLWGAGDHKEPHAGGVSRVGFMCPREE